MKYSNVQQPCHFGKLLQDIKNRRRLSRQLLRNLKKNMPELKKVLKKVSGHWEMEDCVYRFYHGSFKVFYIQDLTFKIIKVLKKQAPKGITFNSDFEAIFKEGTGKKFRSSYNRNWLKHTRSMCEAFFHAKYFLEMAVKYGKKLDNAPNEQPSGWAGLLCFYNL